MSALPGIDLLESKTYARHVHGGPPASIGQATLNVQVNDRRAHSVTVRSIQLLRAHCREEAWHDRKALQVVGYEIFTWDSADPIAKGNSGALLPPSPGRYQIGVQLVPFTAYQACDRFAFAVSLLIDGKALSFEAPLEVMRFEPLRRDRY